MLQRFQDDSLVHYRFDRFLPHSNVRHEIFTRLGGVSQPPFNALNLGRSVGDSPDAVEENYRRVCQVLGVAHESLVTGYQVHSDRVAIVGREHKGYLLKDTDALITHSPDICLTLRFADCVPLVFFDPVQRAVGLAHAGWKGTVSKIGSKVIASLQSAYGSHPADIIAGIGPSIGPCCYQIGADVIQQMEQAFPNTEDLLITQADRSIHLDLWVTNRRALEMCGVQHIEVAGICTSCHRDEFFSHRGDRGHTGRFGAFVMLSA